MLVEQVDAFHHLAERGFSRCRFAVLVVKLLRAVNRNAHKKIVFFEELAPFVGYQRAVGLYAVVDSPPPAIDALQFESLFIEGNGAHQRLAAVPSEQHFGHGLCLDIFFDELFEQLIGDDMVA